MEEVREVVEAHQRILQEEDAKLAHYARINLMPHLGKKTPKPEELQRINPERGGSKGRDAEEEPKVVSIADRRQAREAVIAARKRVPWNSGRSGQKSG